MLMMSFSYFSGSFFHEATIRSPGRFLDEAISVPATASGVKA
jgi:hypothetical protein